MFKKEKLQTGKIINLAKGFNELAVAGEKEGMPAKLSYKLARQILKLEDAVNSFQTQADNILKKYGKEDESTPGSYMITDVNSYKLEIQSLEAIEEEVDLLGDKIKLEEIEGVKVKPSTLMILQEYIEE